MENFGKDPRGVPVDQRWSNQASNQPHDGAGGVPPRQGTVPEFPSEAWQNVSGAAYCQYPPLPPNNRYDYVVQPDVAPDSASTSRRGSAQEQTEEFTIHARTLEKLVADYIEHDDSTYVPDPALLHPEIRKKKPEFTICGKDLDQLMEEYVSSPDTSEEYNPTSTHAEGSFQEQKESSAFQESHSGQRMDEHVRRKDGYCYSPVKKRSFTYHAEPQRHRHVEGDQRADGSYAIPSTSKDSKQERPISRNLAQLAKQLINNSPKLSRDHDFRTEACYYHYRRCFDVDISDESDGSESSEEGQEHHVGAPGVDSKKKERRQRRENQQASEAETAKKKSAEVYFRNRSYKCALEQYNYLLKIHPNNEKYLVSRSTCHMMMRNHCEAINDLRDALAIHSKFLKGYYRLLVFCLITGRIEGIFTFFVAMEEIYASDPMLAAAREGVRKLEKYVLLESQAREKKSYTLAQACIERILDVSPCNIKYKLRKAQYLAYEGNFESSDKIARSILEYDKNNAMAKYVLSLHMYQIDLQETLEFLKPVVLRTPKLLQAVNLYHRTKTILNFIERGTVASQGGQLRDAHHFYVQALRIDSFNRNLKLSVLNKMAVISHQLGMYAQAMSECDRVLQIDQNNIAALATRALVVQLNTENS
ncbi:uncharacterized protein LOC135160398 isoform X2 [Diachasmimorpha longicaudata]|uniref:uncharacterized protein LOC135160398 isoform X2 n=1 Tax=Diachasmimorpha longicaudata TaxID=58733 RepID=UPI0030B90E79